MLRYSEFKSMMRRADNEATKEKYQWELEERKKKDSAILADLERKAKHEEKD